MHPSSANPTGSRNEALPLLGLPAFPAPRATGEPTDRRPANRDREAPWSIAVPDLVPEVRVKIASEPAEWEAAFRVLAVSYCARGYDAPDSRDLRFTPFHVLPDTVTFVAKRDDRVLATLSLIFDNDLLGLPLESVYTSEIDDLRQRGRRLVEVANLADIGLSSREF